jgi:ferritin-like metal-binding protein YciE
MDPRSSAHDVFLTGLRNAHAMESQAVSIIQPQLNRLTHYPEVSELLQTHLRETEMQIGRLEEILAGIDESASMVKDTVMSMAGSMAALTHSAAPDEILKNSFANLAFENYEIAAYTSLLVVAERAGASRFVPLLEQTLQEEREMADAIERMLPGVTERFVTLKASGERADV